MTAKSYVQQVEEAFGPPTEAGRYLEAIAPWQGRCSRFTNGEWWRAYTYAERVVCGPRWWLVMRR